MARKQQQQQQPAAPSPRPPLWPAPIPVIGLTGEYASGKTLFGLSIAPGPATRCYDLEKSSESYASLGFDRVDVPAELLKRHPDGHKPVDLYVWWRDSVREIEPGRFRVVMVDPVTDLEAGLCDWVRATPSYFGHTAAQYAKMEAVYWGDVKALWKSLLVDLASRCETFVFTAHLGLVFDGGKATSKKKPRGKSTLTELASLYLQLERRPLDGKGNLQAVPSAVVRKTRLSHTSVDPTTGEVRIVPALPPRLPVATPAAVRQYQQTPPDPEGLKPEEQAPGPEEEQLSEDERLELRARAAEAEAETERIRAEREERQRQQKQKQQQPPVATKQQPPQAPTAAAGGDLTVKLTASILPQQLERIAALRDELFELEGEEDPEATWKIILGKRGVDSARQLDQGQARQLIEALAFRIDAVKMQRLIEGSAAADGEGEGDGDEDDEDADEE